MKIHCPKCKNAISRIIIVSAIFISLLYNFKSADIYAFNNKEASISLNDSSIQELFCDKAFVSITGSYNLGGRVIVLDENTTLDLTKGFLENGTIVGNNTVLIAPARHIFGDELDLKGTWLVEKSYPQWFGAKGDGKTDDNDAFQKLLNIISQTNINNVFIPQGIYNVKQLKITKNSTLISGDESTYWCSGTILCGTTVQNLIEIDAQAIKIKNLYLCNKNDSKLLNKSTAVYAQCSKNRSGLQLDNISINGYGVGIYTSSSFLSKIVYCRAANCSIGFSVNNFGTSVEMDKCWSLNCDTGYIIKDCTYTKLNNCCSDDCTHGYFIENSQGVELNSCACEMSRKLALTVNDSKVCITNFVTYRCNELLERNVLVGATRDSELFIAGCVVSEKPNSARGRDIRSEWYVQNSYFNRENAYRDSNYKTDVPVCKTYISGKTSALGILDTNFYLSDVDVVNAFCITDSNVILLPFIYGSPSRWQLKVLFAGTMEPIKNKEIEITLILKNN